MMMDFESHLNQRGPPFSGLDLVRQTDNFPYQADDIVHYADFTEEYYTFTAEDFDRSVVGELGMVPNWVAEDMPWDLEHWRVNHQSRGIHLARRDKDGPSFDDIIAAQLQEARASGKFQILEGWRNELYPIRGWWMGADKQIRMERSATPLFGTISYGVHMTVCTETPEGLKIWVPRRAKTKQTYGGMLDNTVAGGLAADERPLDCLVREAVEEASLPEQLVRSQARACGTISYIHVRDERAGGEIGLIQPECQFVYDLCVGPDVVPKPNDSEVEAFYLWSVPEVQQQMAAGAFKPNCALVLLDFFIRRGIITAEAETEYAEIVSRLHRRLGFPLA